MLGTVYDKLGIWGAVIVSTLVLSGFTGICTLLFFKAIPQDSHDIGMALFGALATMATNVVAFWTGSSLGSMQKNNMLNQKDKP